MHYTIKYIGTIYYGSRGNEIKANKGSSGVDGIKIEDIEAMGIEKYLSEIKSELKEGKYKPIPVKRVMIPKPDGSERPLGIPTVKDRIVQMATKIAIEPVFEADFRDCSYGFRPKRSAKHALNLLRYIMEKLDLKLHPVKTKIVSMWDGKEGFDFLGMHHRRMTTETSKGQLYKETYQYPSRKAMKKMKAEIKRNVNSRSLLVAQEEDLIRIESQNHRVEELLFYQDKCKVDASNRLVYYLYFYKVV